MVIGVVRLGIMFAIVMVLVVVADGRVGGSLAGMVDGRGRRIEEQRSSERVEEEKTRETMRSPSFMNRRRRRMVRRTEGEGE